MEAEGVAEAVAPDNTCAAVAVAAAAFAESAAATVDYNVNM